MEPEKTPRERLDAFINRLVPDWRPTEEQVLSAIRVVIILAVLLAPILLIGAWLWGMVADYVHPRTPSDRKDLVNVFVIIGAGIVGLLTAIAAVGNLYISRRNLQQQRDLEAQRAQDDALQAYYKQMGDLLIQHDLKKTDPDSDEDVVQLARAQTLAVVRRLDGRRKSDLVLFLFRAGLINRYSSIVKLYGADLSGADLSGAVLMGTNLGGIDLSGADLSGADLNVADLSFAYLSGADLSNAHLISADLRRAHGLTDEQLSAASSLVGATMPDEQILRGDPNPNGPTFEEWLKSTTRGMDRKNSGSS